MYYIFAFAGVRELSFDRPDPCFYWLCKKDLLRAETTTNPKPSSHVH